MLFQESSTYRLLAPFQNSTLEFLISQGVVKKESLMGAFQTLI